MLACLLVSFSLDWVGLGWVLLAARLAGLAGSALGPSSSQLRILELVRLAFGAPGRGSRVAVHWAGHAHTQTQRSVDFQSSTTQISTGSHFQAAASLPHPQPSSSFPFHLCNPGSVNPHFLFSNPPTIPDLSCIVEFDCFRQPLICRRSFD